MKSLIILFACLNILGTSAQTDSTQFQGKIQLVHNKDILASRVIRSYSRCKVWLKGNDSPIRGYMTFTSDSTATIDNQSISLNDIETIKVVSEGGVVLGSILTVGGVTVTGLGFILMSEGNLLAEFLGAAGVLLGPIPLATGLIVLGVSSRKFDMEKWHFEVVDS